MFFTEILLMCALCFSVETFAGERPNVLILLADDLGINDIGFNNQGRLVTTPHIDDLAREGHYFRQFYTDSTCSPSRAALLTGMHPTRVGFTPVGAGISPQLTTLPELLKQNGYSTYHVGKWHLGEGHELSFPENQGFEKSFGFIDQWRLQGPDESGRWKNKVPVYNNPWLRNEKGEARQYTGHLENILTQHTVNLIHKNKKQPWFIYHAFFAPHEPMQPEASYQKQYGKSGRGKYKALVKQLDDNVGKIVAALRESKQLANTLIIFLSDNGGTERYFPSNYPVYGKKGDYKGGGMRAPMVIYWQGKFTSLEIQSPTAIYDVYPGIAGILDIEMPETDGIDVYSNKKMRPLLFWNKHDSQAVLDVDNQQMWWAGFLGNAMNQRLLSTKYNLIQPELRDDSWRWPLLNQTLRQSLVNWMFETSRTTTSVLQKGEKQFITGDDFRRSVGGRNQAMVFSLNKAGLKNNRKLVGQQGVFRFYVNKKDELIYQLAKHRFNLGIVTQQCQPVIINTELQHPDNSLWQKPPQSRVSIYIEGQWQQFDFVYREKSLDIDAPTVVDSLAIKDFAIYSMKLNQSHPLWGSWVKAHLSSLCGVPEADDNQVEL